MKFYINRKWRNTAYGGGNLFVKAFYTYFEEQEKAGNKIHQLCMPTDPKARPDTMLIVGLDNDGTGISIDQALMYKMTHHPAMKIVLRVNENDARKGTNGLDEKLIKLSAMVDATVFVSHWLKKYFVDQRWLCKNNVVIINGVDTNVFKPAPKLNDGKINIVSHHWSDNYRKGADVTEWLDNEFIHRNKDSYSFTFIGRTQVNLKHSKHVQPLHGVKLGDELAKHDVYVSASRFDPGPNHCIEPISCQLPTYVHKDGGGCVEFAGQDHVYNDIKQLETILLSKKFTPNWTSFKPWNDCIESYVKFIENV